MTFDEIVAKIAQDRFFYDYEEHYKSLRSYGVAREIFILSSYLSQLQQETVIQDKSGNDIQRVRFQIETVVNRLCVDAKINLKSLIESPQGFLQEALKAGDIELLEAILPAKGAAPNDIEIFEGDTVFRGLYWAVKNKHPDLVRWLVARGASVNKPCLISHGTEYLYPLSIALLNDDIGMVELLLSLHADVNCVAHPEPNQTESLASFACHRACSLRMLQFLLTLTAANVDLGIKSELQYVIQHGETDFIDYLMPHCPAYVIKTAKDGLIQRAKYTELMFYVATGNIEKVRGLLTAPVNAIVKHKMNCNQALIIASQLGRTELVQLLLTVGANAKFPGESIYRGNLANLQTIKRLVAPDELYVYPGECYLKKATKGEEKLSPVERAAAADYPRWRIEVRQMMRREQIIKPEKADVAEPSEAAVDAWLLKHVTLQGSTLTVPKGLEKYHDAMIYFAANAMSESGHRPLTIVQQALLSGKNDVFGIMDNLEAQGFRFDYPVGAKWLLGSSGVIGDIFIDSYQRDPQHHACDRIMHLLERTAFKYDATEDLIAIHKFISTTNSANVSEPIKLTNREKSVLIALLKSADPENLKKTFPGWSASFGAAQEKLHYSQVELNDKEIDCLLKGVGVTSLASVVSSVKEKENNAEDIVGLDEEKAPAPLLTAHEFYADPVGQAVSRQSAGQEEKISASNIQVVPTANTIFEQTKLTLTGKLEQYRDYLANNSHGFGQAKKIRLLEQYLNEISTIDNAETLTKAIEKYRHEIAPAICEHRHPWVDSAISFFSGQVKQSTGEKVDKEINAALHQITQAKS